MLDHRQVVGFALQVDQGGAFPGLSFRYDAVWVIWKWMILYQKE